MQGQRRAKLLQNYRLLHQPHGSRTQSTVAREHITAILNKIGASNHTEAVAIALQKQLLKI